MHRLMYKTAIESDQWSNALYKFNKFVGTSNNSINYRYFASNTEKINEKIKLIFIHMKESKYYSFGFKKLFQRRIF